MTLKKYINIVWMKLTSSNETYSYWKLITSLDMWNIASQEIKLNLKYFKPY